jgi:pimeloyl-ACP methyl ester carboxylesterase
MTTDEVQNSQSLVSGLADTWVGDSMGDSIGDLAAGSAAPIVQSGHRPSYKPKTDYWYWQRQRIRYQRSGETGPALVLIHGFGASSDHWRKNLPDWGMDHRVFAIDLLGYGFSDKPVPGDPLAYTFENWGQLVIDFCREVVGGPAVLVGNSIGCIVAMQAAVMAPELTQGVVVLNCSLRLLHERKRSVLPWYRRAPAPLLQKLLAWEPLGRFFFDRLATPNSLRKILCQAYGRDDAVTDELIQWLLAPAFTPGALAVFVSFIQYSFGPLAEDLLPQIQAPVLMLWGELDPWEPIDLGRELANYPVVTDFVPLPGLGHCPQDEGPELVNPKVRDWVAGLGISDFYGVPTR